MFKFFRHIAPRTRILFVAFLLILVPGAVISYLSLQSIREKAENLRTSYSGTLNLVGEKLENDISQLESEFHNQVIERSPGSDQAIILKEWLRNMESDHPALNNLFLVHAEGGLISSSVSAGWQRLSRSPISITLRESASFRLAEEAEFITRNYIESLRYYRDAMSSASSPHDRVVLHSRIGRCYSKLNNHPNAIREFERILEHGETGLTIGNVPASVVAYSQIADAYEFLHAVREKNEALIVLYKHLLEHPWDLAGGEFLYYLRSVREKLDASFATNTGENLLNQDVEELKMVETELRKQINLMEFISEHILPEMESEINLGSLREMRTQTIIREKTDSTFLLSYLKLPAAFQQIQLSALGFQINQEYILSAFIPEVLTTVELGNNILVGIIGERDSILYIQNDHPLKTYLVAEDFSSLYNQWKVALFHPDGKTIEQLIGNEKQLYLALFIGIIVVMVIGIILMIRAVIHESEVSRLKSEFVSNVSHELKTPLALIRMFGETLDSGIVTDEEKRRKFYSIIRKESERLTHLINNVLDFSRMDARVKEYNFQETDLVETVRNSLDAYKYHISDKGFQVEIEFPEESIMLKIDRDAIAQVLLNLLNNAVKYSDEVKHIRVNVRRQEKIATISVTDCGIGISKGEQGKIFNKFYRVSSSRIRDTRGSGLGLTLAKHIVEAHGGTIGVESEPGKGSTFLVNLPLIIIRNVI